MRNAFAEAVTTLASEDPRVVLLSGDIGNRLFDEFKATDPNRFYNCGVAEANMMGVAAGLALSGLRPVVYTITPFTTTRCFEQIRVDVCYHKAPVVIVGTGSGLSYAPLGPTHHSLEDLAILRTLPGMTVMAPADPIECRLALQTALQHPGPVYIRIGKKGEPLIHDRVPAFEIGRFIRLQKGLDVVLIGTGTILSEVLKAAHALSLRGLSVEVVSAHTVKPLDQDYLKRASEQFKLMVTIEEHGLIGGLGSAVAEWRSREGIKTPLLSFGTPDEFMHEVGSQSYARLQYGLTGEVMAQSILRRVACALA